MRSHTGTRYDRRTAPWWVSLQEWVLRFATITILLGSGAWLLSQRASGTESGTAGAEDGPSVWTAPQRESQPLTVYMVSTPEESAHLRAMLDEGNNVRSQWALPPLDDEVIVVTTGAAARNLAVALLSANELPSSSFREIRVVDLVSDDAAG